MAGARAVSIQLNGEDIGEGGGVIPFPDGSVSVTLGDAQERPESSPHFDNLANGIGEMQLSAIANELYEAIEADDSSRATWLTNRARALDLLGLELKQPKGDATGGVEGISTVTAPIMLEAILKGWANSVGEFLPAEGPVKVADRTGGNDELADVLERDINWWLTTVAREYYPDTSHMLLWGPYFGGSGFKKIYECPLRRRPVSESVDPKDFIISDAMKDLSACGRITHQIEMRPSVMKRMQRDGAYRDVELAEPSPTDDAVSAAIGGIQGTTPPSRPEDQPYTVWECQCELVLDEFAPKDFEGIPLPYLVTLDKDSREVLALRRDWEEDDEDCNRRRMYVRWPFVPGPGFYGTGLAQILGNSSSAVTAAWREALDAGMYASFPAGFIDKSASRQNTTVFRMSPGEFAPIDTQGRPIAQAVMGMPYSDVTPGLMNMIDRVTAAAEKLGGAPSLPTDEGIANVPVGSMLAQIEQATQVLAAAHKGLHSAQSEEFELLVALIRRNPGAFITAVNGNPETPRDYWDAAKLEQALTSRQLTPVSDPNVPSHVHRMMKAWGLMTVAQSPQFAPLTNQRSVYEIILRALRIDADLVMLPPEQVQEQGPDPKVQVAQIQAQVKAQSEAAKLQLKAQSDAQAAQLKAGLALQTDERKAQMESQKAVQQAGIEATQAKADIATEQVQAQTDIEATQQKAAAELQREEREAQLKEHLMVLDAGLKRDLAREQAKVAQSAAKRQNKASSKPKKGT